MSVVGQERALSRGSISSSAASSAATIATIHVESSSETAQDLFEATQKLEKQLKLLLKTKNEADESVFALRKNIREHYKKILYKDQLFSVGNDIEQNLWKTVFYKQIEELRKLLKMYSTDTKVTNNHKNSNSSSSNSSSSGKQTKINIENYRRIQKLFRSFLRDASGFYENLLDGHLRICQIGREGSEFRDDFQPPQPTTTTTTTNTTTTNSTTIHPAGKTANTVTATTTTSTHTQSSATSVAEDRSRLYLALLTCHRCLIFLGDLERYYQHVNDTRSYSKAEKYYRQALELVPENGNPHNQLAVISTYTNNNLAAVHRYFRSLAVTGQPFLTALTNLRLIFDKNHIKVLKYKQKDLESGVTPNYDSYIGDLRRVDTFIVKLYGILYTSTDLELFVPIEKAVVKKLDALFFRRMRQSVRRFSEVEKHRFSNFAMQVLTGCIFLVHNTCNPVEERVKAFQTARRASSEGGGGGIGGLDGGQEDSGELPGCEVNPNVGLRAIMTPAQRMGHAYACILVFDFMWLVIRSVDKETLTLISVVAVFCDWLKLYPHIVNPDKSYLSETEIVSRRNLWTSFVNLYHQLILLKEITLEAPTAITNTAASTAITITATATISTTAPQSSSLEEGGDHIFSAALSSSSSSSSVPILEEEVELGGFSFVRDAYPQAKYDFSSVRRGLCAAPLPRNNHHNNNNNNNNTANNNNNNSSNSSVGNTNSSDGKNNHNNNSNSSNSNNNTKLDIRRNQQLLRCRKVIDFVHFARDLEVLSLDSPSSASSASSSSDTTSNGGWGTDIPPDTPDMGPSKDPKLGSPALTFASLKPSLSSSSSDAASSKSDVVEWILTPSTPPVRNDTGPGKSSSQRKAGKKTKLGKSKIPREEADSAEWNRGPCQPTRTLLTRTKLESVVDEVTLRPNPRSSNETITASHNNHKNSNHGESKESQEDRFNLNDDRSGSMRNNGFGSSGKRTTASSLSGHFTPAATTSDDEKGLGGGFYPSDSPRSTFWFGSEEHLDTFPTSGSGWVPGSGLNPSAYAFETPQQPSFDSYESSETANLDLGGLGIGGLKEDEGEGDAPEGILAGWSPFGTGNLTSFLGGNLFNAENSADSNLSQDPSFTSFSAFSAFSSFSKPSQSPSQQSQQQSQPQPQQVRRLRQAQPTSQQQHLHPQDSTFTDDHHHFRQQQPPQYFHPPPPHMMQHLHSSPPPLHNIHQSSQQPLRQLSAQAAPWEAYSEPYTSSLPAGKVYYGDGPYPIRYPPPQLQSNGWQGASSSFPSSSQQKQWNWGAS